MAGTVFVGIVVAGVVVLWKMGSSSRGKASKRLVVVVFAVLVVTTILVPELTTKVANLVGIGRGADLVLYLTSIGLMFLAALTYIGNRRTEDRVARLVSEQATAAALSQWRGADPAEDGGETNPASPGP